MSKSNKLPTTFKEAVADVAAERRASNLRNLATAHEELEALIAAVRGLQERIESAASNSLTSDEEVKKLYAEARYLNYCCRR